MEVAQLPAQIRQKQTRFAIPVDLLTHNVHKGQGVKMLLTGNKRRGELKKKRQKMGHNEKHWVERENALEMLQFCAALLVIVL